MTALAIIVPEVLESVEQARLLRRELSRRWYDLYHVKDEYPEEFAETVEILDRLKAQATKQFAKADSFYPDMTCAACREYSVFDGPKHNASRGCASGQHAHCSCGVCF